MHYFVDVKPQARLSSCVVSTYGTNWSRVINNDRDGKKIMLERWWSQELRNSKFKDITDREWLS